MKLRLRITQSWPFVLFAAITLFLFFTNYTQGTYLTGWDNLHPEFDFKTYFVRSIFAVWQEYQGLGLLGGMGHAADLPRAAILFLFSFVLPISLLRYFWTFLMILTGLCGMYLLLKHEIVKDREYENTGALLGSLFYLLNLGTIQYFFAPFDPYTTFWGLFPWEMYTLFRVSQKPTRRNFCYLALVNLLAVPQAYVQTIFLVYLLCVGIYLLLVLIKEKTKKRLVTTTMILGIIFCINAFWLLPNLYFVATHLPITQHAMQNEMSTDVVLQMNKKRHTVTDFPLLKEFHLDITNFDQEKKEHYYLLHVWREHFAHPLVLGIGYLFFAIVLVGIAQKTRYRSFLVSIGIVALLIFLSELPLLATLNDLFRAIPVVNQVFRNPLTKFLVPVVFLFAIGFGIGITILLQRTTHRLRAHKASSALPFVLPLSIALLLFAYVLPAFEGNFLSPEMRLAIPKEYFSLFSYLKTQEENGRVLNLPQINYWGSSHYTWGYRGSGFLWHGITQPITDRAFDVWSKESEQYFWELSYALNKQDRVLFTNLLQKYQIQWILLDEYLKHPQHESFVISYEQQKMLVEANPLIRKEKQFGHLALYSVIPTQTLKTNIGVVTKTHAVAKNSNYVALDQAFTQQGFYTTTDTKTAALLYPFETLFTNRPQPTQDIRITENDTSFILKTTIPQGKYTLRIPSSSVEHIIPMQIRARKQHDRLFVTVTAIAPKLVIGDTTIAIPEKSYETETILPKDESDFLLTIGDNTFPMHLVSSDWQTIGQTYIPTKTPSILSLYSYKHMQTKTIPTDALSSPADVCAPQPKHTTKQFAKTQATKDALTLKGLNTALCSSYMTPLTDIANALINVSFEYKTAYDEQPKYCLYSQHANKCLNAKEKEQFGFATTWAQFSEYVSSSTIPGDTARFTAILQADHDERINFPQEIQYRNIQVTTYPFLTQTTIATNDLLTNEQEKEVTLPTDTMLQIQVPKLHTPFSFEKPLASNLYTRRAWTSEKILPGTYTLKEAYEQGKKTILLSATDAASYFLFQALELQPGSGYIASLDAKNLAGFPLSLSLFSQLQYRDYTYRYIENNGKNYFVLPPLAENDKGINFLLMSRSYNTRPTENSIGELALYPLPFHYIQQLNLSPNIPPTTYRCTQNDISFQKENISLYTGTIHTNSSCLILLSQSFDSGWQMYQVAPTQNALFRFFQQSAPFLFGNRVTTHQKINNWENGWITTQAPGSRFIIVYLPQYLAYIGFLLPLFLLEAIAKPLCHPRLDRGSDSRSRQE